MKDSKQDQKPSLGTRNTTSKEEESSEEGLLANVPAGPASGGLEASGKSNKRVSSFK
jgi:hypothetical protein